MVAIFGKYEDGATTDDDAGIAGYNSFVRAVRSELGAYGLVTTPAEVPLSPGVAVPDVTFEATLAGGKKVKVTALLVDNVRTAGATFDARYEALSTTADLISYSGHAGATLPASSDTVIASILTDSSVGSVTRDVSGGRSTA
jgi:hypothetical protein